MLTRARPANFFSEPGASVGGEQLILALDQGTTGSTAVLYALQPSGTRGSATPEAPIQPSVARTGEMRPIAAANHEFAQIYPASGLVEHNTDAIWQSVCAAVAAVLDKAKSAGVLDAASRIAAIGVTNQRETVVCLDRQSLKPLCHAIVWQDRRTADRCQELRRDKGLAARIRNVTGLVLDPYFSATKIEWLLRNNNDVAQSVARGRGVFATMDAFVCMRLTGGEAFVTEPTNASRTLLVRLEDGEYDEELLALFGIPRAALPRIQDSMGLFGRTKGVPGLPDGIPITAMLGDQQAALYGQGAHSPGEAKVTFGTGSFVLMNTGSSIVRTEEKTGLLTSIALRHQGKLTYCIEGACFIAGAAVQFLRDQLGFFSEASASESLALSEPADPEVEFVPSLAGLSAPFWNPRAKGVLFGLSRGTSRAHITRAVLESLALQHVSLLGEMQRSSGIPLRWLGVDGGAARNEYLLQFQADVLQRPLRRPADLEATAAGAARAAWMALGSEHGAPTGHVQVTEIRPTRDAAWAEVRFSRWLRAAAAVHAYYS